MLKKIVNQLILYFCPMKTFLSKQIHWVFLVILVMIWGSSFFLMKRSLHFFSPIELGTLRMTFAALVLIPFSFRYLKQLTRRHWIILAIVGTIGNALPALLFAKAQTGIDSSLSGVLNATTPLFVAIIGVLFYKLKLTFLNVVGLILGLIGAVEIIGISGIGNFDHNMHYAWYIVVATIMYAVNINLIKNKLDDLNSNITTIISIGIVGIPMAAILFFGTPFLHTIQNPEAVKALIYPATLGIMCSSVALLLYYRMIQLTNVVFSSSVTYLIPIVALIIGVFDNEPFKSSSIIWIVLILIGIYLVNRKQKKGKE